MNYKKFKNLSEVAKKDESYYLIGLDIGNNSTAIAYFNAASEQPESIDLSGGYGKPSIPTVVQYIPETKEWVIGEYAVLNQGAGIVFFDLLKRMGKNEYVELGGRLASLASVFSVFVKEVLLSINNINPKAEIVGIVCTVPAYFSDGEMSELKRVFQLAGYEKELIGFVSDRECVLAEYIHSQIGVRRDIPAKLGRNAAARASQALNKNVSAPKFDETVLVLDFGSRELRGGVYAISSTGGEAKAVCLSFYFDESVSMESLDEDVYKLFMSFLESPVREEYKEELAGFHHQYKDMLFQKNIREKPLKLYYNFVYPPIQCVLNYSMTDRLIRPYERKFLAFVKEVVEKSKAQDIDTVLCVGGGFEMLWAREAVCKVFAREAVRFAKSSKLVGAIGASIISAGHTGLLDINLVLEDTQKLDVDIGLYDGENFFGLAARNSFWWQKHTPKLVLVHQEVTGKLTLSLVKQASEDFMEMLDDVLLEGLPNRPKGVTCLEVGICFTSSNSLELVVRDAGFGELFPKSDYEGRFTLQLSNS